jgi:small subunit ribosomal protein S1
MVDKNVIKDLAIPDADLEQAVAQSLGETPIDAVQQLYEQSVRSFEVGSILKGRVLQVIGDDVVVDVGYKSEGVVSAGEFSPGEALEPGQEIEVLLEEVEDDSGLIVLSKRRADRIRGWERVIENHQEGDVVSGRVTRKIKGGLLVDIGVPVFLPASQVNIRRTGDIAEYIGREIKCKILKIDESRRNIVVSRRKLIEEERERAKQRLMAEIEIGQVRKGVVKNIADFGAFVDLGGIDGLLHITDMSWGRVSHPSELVKIDDQIEVKILSVDREREKIALGLKQKQESPWARVEDRYPLGSRHKGEVVNVMSYGAFVKLEEGIEGLVHISDMSWTRRIKDPSEVVAIGDSVEVVVLDINREKEEISLGMKQTEVNPWTLVEQKYPPGTRIKGRVRNLTNYGAFIEIEEGIDGLLHVSDISWTKKVAHPNEILKKGDLVETVVLSVNQEKMRVALGMKQLSEDPWERDIPSRYMPGEVVSGKVTKIASFGVFVELEQGLEGLLHISELADHKVESPEDVVKVGDDVKVKILRVDQDERKIGLSLKRVQWAAPTQSERDRERAAEAEAEVQAEVQAEAETASLAEESSADEPRADEPSAEAAAPPPAEAPEEAAAVESPADPAAEAPAATPAAAPPPAAPPET